MRHQKLTLLVFIMNIAAPHYSLSRKYLHSYSLPHSCFFSFYLCNVTELTDCCQIGYLHLKLLSKFILEKVTNGTCNMLSCLVILMGNYKLIFDYEKASDLLNTNRFATTDVCIFFVYIKEKMLRMFSLYAI